ncbi:hypothetical protein [Streptomyces sp. T028]|uniref:hypothetical protein n=1 Tax=Streptomyces sp. T028 TaxID=3394379 RepID=UPI003A869588
MTTKPANPTSTIQPAISCASLKSARTFEMRFTSTPRGARLAAVRLDEWGIPYGTGPHEAIVLILVSHLATRWDWQPRQRAAAAAAPAHRRREEPYP